MPGYHEFEADYYNKYGPTCEKRSSITPITANVTESTNNIPALNFNLQKKIIASTDNLVLNVTTNNYHNASDLYYFTVKQKERVIYNEIMSFSKNVPS